jgi:hypothetical protein
MGDNPVISQIMGQVIELVNRIFIGEIERFRFNGDEYNQVIEQGNIAMAQFMERARQILLSIRDRRPTMEDIPEQTIHAFKRHIKKIIHNVLNGYVINYNQPYSIRNLVNLRRVQGPMNDNRRPDNRRPNNRRRTTLKQRKNKNKERLQNSPLNNIVSRHNRRQPSLNVIPGRGTSLNRPVEQALVVRRRPPPSRRRVGRIGPESRIVPILRIVENI